MGVSSTRVGDHRGSARTVQFYKFSLDNPHSEVRAFRHIPHFPHTSQVLWRSFLLLCKPSLLLAVRPFLTPRRLFSCPFRAGSGLPFLWVRFPHSPSCKSSSPLPLHPILHLMSSRETHISFPIDKSSYLHTLSSSACPIHKSPSFLFVYLYRSFIYLFLLLIVYIYRYCDITHNPSSFPNLLLIPRLSLPLNLSTLISQVFSLSFALSLPLSLSLSLALSLSISLSLSNRPLCRSSRSC